MTELRLFTQGDFGAIFLASSMAKPVVVAQQVEANALQSLFL